MALSHFQNFEELQNRNRFSVRKLQDMSNPVESLSEHQFHARFRLSKDFISGLETT